MPEQENITFDIVVPPIGTVAVLDTVPNQFPRFEVDGYRIAIIGEAPGKDEATHKLPFVGQHGRLLDSMLSSRNIMRGACFIGYVCQVQPPDNDIDELDWHGAEIQSGLVQLKADLDKFNPHLCILLGNTPLRAALGLGYSEGKLKERGITEWRGSVFLGTEEGPLKGRKCLATYHPAYALRVWDVVALMRIDLRKAREEGATPDYNPPVYDFDLFPTSVDDVIARLQKLRDERKLVSMDIEGYWTGVTCISFTSDPKSGFIVPFFKLDGTPYWDSVEDTARLWWAVKELCEDKDVPKVLQNSLYDRFVLAFAYGILIRNVKHDTMLMHWEKFCELKKSLGLQCSIYTKQAYYKSDRKSNDQRTYYQYCCIDSAVTLEICQILDADLKGPSRSHYFSNMGLLDSVLYMELKGIRYDIAKAQQKLDMCIRRIGELQYAIDQRNGTKLDFPTPDALLAVLCDAFAKKRERQFIRTIDDLQWHCRKDALEEVQEVTPIVKQMTLTWPPQPHELGLISAYVGVGMNPDSSKQLQAFLYGKKMLPVQRKKDPKTGAMRPTTNYEALLKLRKHAPDDKDVPDIIEITTLLTLSSMLRIHADRDQRIRCGYNVVGTESGRFTCYKSPTGSGYNLTTIPDANHNWPIGHPLQPGMRDLFLADVDHDLFQCDLAGADAWTVAAHAARLGDPRMLSDLLSGIKVAKVMVLMFKYGPDFVARMSQAELLAATKAVSKDDPLYFGAKCCQHGSNYGMGKVLMSATILIQSEGKVIIPAADCEKMQRYYFARYPGVLSWHRWLQNEIKTKGYLLSASGQLRHFFGRRDDHGTFKQALAHEPQSVTTYATSCAMLKLWNDPLNRTPSGALIIKPMHQVHDALVGQWPVAVRAWACKRVPEYFANTIIVAGQPITIPFEGRWGRSWGELNNDLTA